jgi:hypothetical protein
MSLDPMSARIRASSINMWEATGRCLQFVNWAFGEPTSRMTSNGRGSTADGNWQDAKEGWYGSLHQHPGDGTDAPAGVPIYWETGPSGNPAGHIALSDGDGWCYTTDYAGPRSVSRQRVAYLNSLRGRALGWTEDFGGNPIAGITSADPIETPPIITQQEELPMDINYLQITNGKNAGRIYAVDAKTGKVRHINVYEARAIARNRGLSLEEWAIKHAEDINEVEEEIVLRAGYIS